MYHHYQMMLGLVLYSNQILKIKSLINIPSIHLTVAEPNAYGLEV